MSRLEHLYVDGDPEEEVRWSWARVTAPIGEIMSLESLRFALRQLVMRPVRPLTLGYIALLVVVLGVLVDVVWAGPRRWFDEHQFTASIVVEALLLATTVGLLDRALERREVAKWESAAARPLRQVHRWLASAHVSAGNWRFLSMTASETAAAIVAQNGAAPSAQPLHARLTDEASRADAAERQFRYCLGRLDRALGVYEPLALAHSSLIARYSAARAYARQGRRIDALAEIHYDDGNPWDVGEWRDVVAAFGSGIELDVDVYARQLANYGALIDWPEADAEM